jgi:hypothetical protein
VEDLAANQLKSDIVFVQLPKSDVQDASGGWLGASVLDGVNYIMAFAEPETRVVICISYGSTVGPHDGSSLLETALDRLLLNRNSGREANSQLDVVMAAGNGFESRGHALLRLRADKRQHITWRVLPGSEACSFLQLWWPSAAAPGARAKIVPPGVDPRDCDWLKLGQARVWPNETKPQAMAMFAVNPSRGEGRSMVLLALSPTECIDARPHPVAAHGDWTLYVKSPVEVEVHVYVSRNDPDIGALLRGRQSYLVDPLDDPERYLRPARDDVDVCDPRDAALATAREGAQIRRRGTINGIATGRQVKVAAGYCLLGGARARYSSAGEIPSRSVDNASPVAAHSKQADYALPTDESAVLVGIRAGGTRGGSTFRLVGTSTAAPQYARKLVDGTVHSREPTPPGLPARDPLHLPP